MLLLSSSPTVEWAVTTDDYPARLFQPAADTFLAGLRTEQINGSSFFSIRVPLWVGDIITIRRTDRRLEYKLFDAAGNQLGGKSIRHYGVTEDPLYVVCNFKSPGSIVEQVQFLD